VDFLQLNHFGNSPYVTSSLTGEYVCVLWISFAFVKCTNRTLYLRSTWLCGMPFFPGIDRPDESDNLEWRTSNMIRDLSLRAGPNLYAADYWAHSAASKFHFHYIVTCQHIARQRLYKYPALYAHSNRTAGLCNPFLGNGSVNTLPRRQWCHTIVDRNHMWRVFCRSAPEVCGAQQK
jgi:hypothetical protein